MPSLIYTSTGKFAGNCFPDETPPPGQTYVATDPPDGMDDPHYLDGWVAGDPPSEAEPDTSPNYSGAWQPLATSELYQWLNGVALATESMRLSHHLSMLGTAIQGWRDSDPAVWAQGVSAGIAAIDEQLAVLQQPLPEEHRQWLTNWNAENRLGLSLPWEPEP